MLRLQFIAIVLILTGVLPARGDAPRLERGPDFALEVAPILSRTCFPCHGPDDEARQADLRLDNRDSATAALNESDWADSPLLTRILSSDPDERMPPPEFGKDLSDEQRDLLKAWVMNGAPYAQHWAFTKPQKSNPPTIEDDDWSASPIDPFVLTRMREQQVAPAPRANRYALIRRLYLDLLGVLPTMQQTDAFVQDVKSDAYDRLVDSLLSSPQYGERWARPWLDLARFSDTNGYEKDRPRSVWPYRDWVIDALNQDLPYDQFSIEQIAGDMLPNATQAQRVATGFHRNTMLNEEGGIDPLEYRFYAMVDRVATTGTVWMGLTVGCAQCHSHKYDPITHSDYYSFMALLDNTNEPDLFLDQDEKRNTLKRRIAQLEASATQELLASDRLHKADSELHLWQRNQSQHAATWTSAKPIDCQSNLPKLTIQDDHSVFASGDFTKRDEYSVTLALPQDKPITAVRLEALPDDRLPAAGPGRTYYEGRKGQFFLSEIEFSTKEEPGIPASGHPISVASFSNSKKPFEPSKSVYDGNGSSGWSNDGNAGVRHTMVVRFQRPIQAKELQVRMLFERHFVASLGRFRFSVTSNEGDIRAVAIDPSAESVLGQKRPTTDWTPAQQQSVAREFLRHSPKMAEKRKTIERLRDQLTNRTHTLVMTERSGDNRRITHLHHRGEYLSPREQVAGRIPGIFQDSNVVDAAAGDTAAADASAARPGDSPNEGPNEGPANRLELAQWLVSPENPLFARVVANRTWRHFLGEGLVRSDGDFGTQAAPPTHPQLLDWLAVHFIEQGMSIKHLHRQVVMSATYQQASSPRDDLQRKDPQNELFARGPRHRVDGETIRDIYLSAAKILSTKLGGPSVKPPQPASVTAVAWGNTRWDAAQGEARFRRSLYTFSKRTAPFAAFATFDGPSGETCVAKRNRSNTPLQALTLLNDAMFIEMAQKLGQSIYRESTDETERLRIAFRRLLVRPPSKMELTKLQRYYQTQLDRLSTGELSAPQIAGNGNKAKDLAALVMVTRVLMNLDETITKQ